MGKKQKPRLREGAWSHFGTCIYCKREITRKDLDEEQRTVVQNGHEIGHTFRWSRSPASGHAPTIRYRYAHRRCRLKALLGLKHYRKHL